MATARVYCGASEEAIRATISDNVDTLTVYGAGSNFTLSKEFIDIVLSLKATITTFNLEEIHNIGKEAFRYVKYIKSSAPTGLSINVNADDTLEVIEPYAFAQTNILRSIDLPKSIKRIENCAFFDCQRLRRVRFKHEDNVSALEYIGMSAFQDCTSLEQIGRYDGEAEGYFPEGLKVIDAYAFARCSALTIVFHAPASLTTIGAYAFAWSGIGGFWLQEGLNKRTNTLPAHAELDTPADITLCSKRQFRYFHVDVNREVNRIQLPDEFVTCVNDDQFMIFSVMQTAERHCGCAYAVYHDGKGTGRRTVFRHFLKHICEFMIQPVCHIHISAAMAAFMAGFSFAFHINNIGFSFRVACILKDYQLIGFSCDADGHFPVILLTEFHQNGAQFQCVFTGEGIKDKLLFLPFQHLKGFGCVILRHLMSPC